MVDEKNDTQETPDPNILCYWCMGEGRHKIGETTSGQPRFRQCSHCKGTGLIPNSTPFPKAPTAKATVAAVPKDNKPIGRGRASSSSRASKKRAKKASARSTNSRSTKKATVSK
jgi:hypothetical protein